MIADNTQPQGKPETRRFRGKLARNLMAILIPLTIIPTFIMGLVSFIRTRTTLIDQISEQLNDVLLQETFDLDNWLIKKQARLSKTAGDQGFLTAAQDLFESQSGSYTHETSHSIVLEKIRSINPSLTNPIFSQFMLLDINGTVLAATKSKWEGLDLSGEDYFSQNVLGSESAAFFAIDLTTLYPPSQTSESGLNINSNIIQISSYQLFDNQDNQLGYIIGIADVFSIQSVLETNSGYLPESKIFLYTEDGHFIGMTMLYGLIVIDPSEDQNNIILGDLDPGAPASALKSYNGEDVFGLYDFYSRLNIGILVEAPQTKVFSQINSLAPFFLLLAFVTILVIAALIFLGTQRFTSPIIRLTESAREVAAGNLDIRVDISRDDEIGELSSAFNSMASQLNNLITNLEQQVSERTMELEHRAIQMETAALVAREAAEIHDLNQLLTRAVHLISERFGFYHAGIFLLDERKEYAVLQAVNSEGGQRMLARGHKLQVGKVGVVGYAAGMAEPRIAQDVGADVTYYDNPDMPNTRSEMALPLIVRGNVIGVLDVQSIVANAFLREDLEVLQILADQIALAINNTQLLQGSQRALGELERFYSQEVSQAWKQELTGKEITYQYNPVGVALRRPGVRILDDDRGEFGHKLKKDITFRGQVIGSIDLQREVADEGWSEEEELLVEEILEQTALALENARLVDQIRFRSDQIHLLQEITALAASLLDENELLNSVAQKLFKGLELLQCSVVLYDENRNYGTILAKANEDEDLPVVSSIMALDEDEINQLLMDKKEIIILSDVKNDPRSSIYSLAFSSKDTQTTIILPLIVRGEVIGIINLDVEDPEREINDEDLNLFNQISVQVSTAIDSTRLLSAEQRGRQTAAAMLEISQIASSTLDLDQVLLEITQRSAAAVQAHRCTISLIDKEENTLKVIMSRFADPHHHDEKLSKIFETMETDTLDNFPLYQQVIEENKPVLLDVASQPFLMPSKWVEPLDIKKMLVVPLISQDAVFGFLIFDHVNANESFTNEQMELAQTIAGQIGTTIENANLFSQTVHRAERERLVAEITTRLRTSNDPRTILQTAMSELRNALTRSRTQIPTGSDGDVDQKKIEKPEKSDQEESFDMEGK